MKRRFLNILFLFNVLVLILSANDIRDKTEETIHNVFPGDVNTEMITFQLPADLKTSIEKEVRQKFFEDKLYIWKVTKNGEVTGFAILDNVYGKSMPITFLVIFDGNCKILNSSVIKYREPYGGAVRNEEWNSQFKNKDADSGYDVGIDIDGISGATISVNSISKGVRKLALLMPEIKDSL